MLVLVDNLKGFESLAMLPVAISQACQHAENAEIAFDLFEHARAQYFDDDFGAGLEPGSVNLCNRRGRQGFGIEAFEYVLHRFSIGVVDDLNGRLGREWWYGVLQFGEFVSDVGRQQVTSG